MLIYDETAGGDQQQGALGDIAIPVDAGAHRIVIEYGATMFGRIGNAVTVSAAAVLALMLGSAVVVRRTKRNETRED